MKKSLGIVALFLASSFPVFAGTSDQSVIVMSGSAADTCTIGPDVRRNFSRVGDKLEATGTITLSQSATTEWELKRTRAEQNANGYKVVATVKSTNVDLTSTESNGQKRTINGAWNDTADVKVIVNSDGSQALKSGAYLTTTEIICDVK